MTPRSERPCVSVPATLAQAYRAAAPLVPPISTLLACAMRRELTRAGVDVPPHPPPDRLTVARARRWPR